MHRREIRIHGRADRIDRLADGTLAMVDYKTGKPPSKKMVKDGFALQLGLIALIAEAGGFAEVNGAASAFEYWSLGKNAAIKDRDEFGYVAEPVTDDERKRGRDLMREDFLPEALRFLDDALDRWILGNEPFTARLNPELASYADYDQLMRLDEWITTLGGALTGRRTRHERRSNSLSAARQPDGGG